MTPNQPKLMDFDLFVRDPDPAPAAPAEPVPAPGALRYSVHQIVDQQMGGGMPIAAFRHPAHWLAQSQAVWNLQKQSLPLQIFANTSDPITGDWVEFLPVAGFYWLEPNWGFGRKGQEDGGVVLMPPMPAADALVKFILPRYRSQGVSGLKIVNIEQINPQRMIVPGFVTPPGPLREAARVRIEYFANGRSLEEEIFGLKAVYPGIATYGAAGQIVQQNWALERVFSFGGNKGRLDAGRATAWAIFDSVRSNPSWEALYARINQQIVAQFNANLQAGYDAIAAAGQLSRQISANNDALLHQFEQQRHASNLADQHRRQANAAQTYTTTDAFSDMIMGRDTYDDPYYPNGSQHDFHDEVWTDGHGNYEYRDNGGADPNVGSDRTWTPLQRRQVNG